MTVTGCRCCCWNRYGRREGGETARARADHLLYHETAVVSLARWFVVPPSVRSFVSKWACTRFYQLCGPTSLQGREARKEGRVIHAKRCHHLSPVSLSLSLSLQEWSISWDLGFVSGPRSHATWGQYFLPISLYLPTRSPVMGARSRCGPQRWRAEVVHYYFRIGVREVVFLKLGQFLRPEQEFHK